MKRFSRAVLFLTAILPVAAAGAKTPVKKNVHVSAQPPSRLEPSDLMVVDGLEYPVPRNINRKPAFPAVKSAKNVVGPPAPPPEVYTAVDASQ